MKRKLVEHYGLETHIIPEDGSDPDNEDFRVAFYNLSLTVKDGKPIQIPGIDYLFIGSIGAAYNKEKLLQHGITHILCLSEIIKMNFPESFTYLRIPMIDRIEYDITEDLDKIFEFITTAKENNGKILVHCYQGKSRSCAICCAYMIKYYNHTLLSSLELIRTVRPIASPNSGFLSILQNFETIYQCSTTNLNVNEAVEI